MLFFFFFFNDTATTEIYTLSLHDALPIYTPRWLGTSSCSGRLVAPGTCSRAQRLRGDQRRAGSTRSFRDRKSTRLNSSHANISYAVFCLKKKKRTPSSSCTPYLHSSVQSV